MVYSLCVELRLFYVRPLLLPAACYIVLCMPRT